MVAAAVAVNASTVMAAAAVAGVLYQLISGKRSQRRDQAQRIAEARDSAREEALALAKTRGEAVEDLTKRVERLGTELERERERHEREVRRLEEALKHSREEAQETQRLLVVGFRGAMGKLLAHLEASPIEVEAAIVYLRDILTSEGELLSAPRRPSRSR